MYKLLVLLLCAFLTLADPGVAAATEASVATTAMTVDARPVPRPNYRRYKGRKKHRKPGFFKRWAARRKAKRKIQAAPARKGVITVDPRTRNK